MTEAKWKIDIYGYKISDATTTVTEALEKAGLAFEFHNMSSEAPVIQAVAKNGYHRRAYRNAPYLSAPWGLAEHGNESGTF